MKRLCFFTHNKEALVEEVRKGDGLSYDLKF